MAPNPPTTSHVILLVERAATDATIAPDGASLICEADWKNLVGEPGEGETFRDREVAYIDSIGLVEAKNEGE